MVAVAIALTAVTIAGLMPPRAAPGHDVRALGRRRGRSSVVACGAARVHTLPGLMVVLLLSGAASITVVSVTNVLVQTMSPEWVRARVLAVFLLVTQGGLSAGSAIWGVIASRASRDEPG
jgi:Transmembrane secretion effector